jgi:hypothetical protein
VPVELDIVNCSGVIVWFDWPKVSRLHPLVEWQLAESTRKDGVRNTMVVNQGKNDSG